MSSLFLLLDCFFASSSIACRVLQKNGKDKCVVALVGCSLDFVELCHENLAIFKHVQSINICSQFSLFRFQAVLPATEDQRKE